MLSGKVSRRFGNIGHRLLRFTRLLLHAVHRNDATDTEHDNDAEYPIPVVSQEFHGSASLSLLVMP